ncbi:MAG: glycosyltransferase [Nitrospirae bacterium]|nr:MAG: glycosyltransferase [Nitrospirota bacterium]
MRILVIQTGSFEHAVTARNVVLSRYPDADVVGLIHEPDLQRARRALVFSEVYRMPSQCGLLAAPAPWSAGVDLCVIPFEDRLGVRYWTFRRVPIVHGIVRIASYNNCGRFREWSRSLWMLNSLVACVGVRTLQALVQRLWSLSRRWGDVLGLFALGGGALAIKGLRAMGMSLFRANLDEARPAVKQRLVLFIPSLGLGGAQRQLASYLKHLDRNRWVPEVVTLTTPDRFFEPMIRSLDVPITHLDPYRRFEKIGVVWQLVGYLRAQPCHVLHAWLHYAAALGAIAGSIAGTPVIVGSLRSERPGRFPWFYPRWQRALDVLTAPLQTYLIANSNAVLDEHRRWAFAPAGKCRRVYNGIEAEGAWFQDAAQQARLKAEMGLPVGASAIGIVGRLSREKDHETFLRAAQAISRSRPDVRFLIVGDGPMRGEIETGITRLGLSGLVQILGERRDALAVIGVLDVLVLTSVSEGLPNVLLEAAVLGTAVVTTAAGGAAEAVVDGETGFVTPCGDAEAVAQGVLTFLRDQGLRKRVTAAASERARACFSADLAAAQIAACYEAVPLPVEQERVVA